MNVFSHCGHSRITLIPHSTHTYRRYTEIAGIQLSSFFYFVAKMFISRRSSFFVSLFVCFSLCIQLELATQTINGSDEVALFLQSIIVCLLSANVKQNGVIHSSHFSFVSNANVWISNSTG